MVVLRELPWARHHNVPSLRGVRQGLGCFSPCAPRHRDGLTDFTSRGLTRACSRQAGPAQDSVRAASSLSTCTLWKEGLCGHGPEGLQLMRISLGSTNQRCSMSRPRQTSGSRLTLRTPAAPWPDSGSVGLCGRQHGHLQLMRNVRQHQLTSQFHLVNYDVSEGSWLPQVGGSGLVGGRWLWA